MARAWDDNKFCGYFDEEYIAILKEFCKCLEPYGEIPRLYYEWEMMEKIVCIEFHPGTDTIMYSSYDFLDIVTKAIDEQQDGNKDAWDIYNSVRQDIIANVLDTDADWPPFEAI